MEGQIERESVECLEYDDEFCCGSDTDDGRPLARWLHFGTRHPPPSQPRHSVLEDDEQLLVEGILHIRFPISVIYFIFKKYIQFLIIIIHYLI